MKGTRLAMVIAMSLGMCLLSTLFPLGNATAISQSSRVVAAPASTVTLNAVVGFNGYIKQGVWMPVYVTLSSSEPFDGEVAVSTVPDRSRLYGAPVTMARGSRKQLILYAPPTPNPIEVLFLSSGKVIAATTPPVHTINEEDRLALVVSEPTDGMNFLNDLHTPFSGKTYVAQLLASDIPEHTAALDAADLLVFNNIDTLSLSDAQRAAIRAWVLGGGHLLLGGGPGARLTVDGFDELAAARVGATVQNSPIGILRQLLTPNIVDVSSVISAATILSSTNSNAPELSAPVVTLQPASADTRSLISSKDTPLVMRRQLGRGTVDQLAFDPTLAPIRDWPDRRLIFAGLLGGQVGATNHVGSLRAEGSAINAARALSGAALPPFLVIAGYLLLYVLTIGPINFFFLRKLNRLSWAWVTIPGTVVLFALIGYATGFRLRGNEPEVHRLSIITGDAQVTDGRAQSIVGLFSPRRMSLDMSTGNALAQEIQPNPNLQDKLSFRLSAPNLLERVVATNSDVRSFYLQGESKLPNIKADMQFIPGHTFTDTARIRGEIRNESGASLTDCVLLAGKDYRVIGNIGPNQHVNAEVALYLGRPELGFIMPSSRLPPTGYASSLGTTFGRSAYSSASLSSFRSPFDLDGASIAESILNWRSYRDDRLKEQAERGLVTAVYSDPDATLGNGLSLACWEEQDRIGAQVQNANYTDRGLRVWRLPVHPFLAGSGAVLPPDAFEWSVLSSSSTVAIDENGLDLEVGDHIIGLSPWLSVRSAGPVSVTLGIGTSANSSLPALQSSSVWLYDWSALQFTEVITSMTYTPVEVQVMGAYLSAAGELRARVDVREDQITLVNIQAGILTP